LKFLSTLGAVLAAALVVGCGTASASTSQPLCPATAGRTRTLGADLVASENDGDALARNSGELSAVGNAAETAIAAARAYRPTVASDPAQTAATKQLIGMLGYVVHGAATKDVSQAEIALHELPGGDDLTPSCAQSSSAAAPSNQTETATNPVHYDGGPMGCPDPDVFPYDGGYVASCTSGDERPSLPIYYSTDLKTWTLKAYINPPASMTLAYGQLWADEIHYLDGWWTAWYALQMPNRQMAIAESWSQNLFASDWATKMVYIAPNGQWAIDPSLEADPQNPSVEDMVFMIDGHIYITYLTGPIWHVARGVYQISQPTLSWENGWEEGPVLWKYGNTQYVLYNASNTWNGTYAIGVLSTTQAAFTRTYVKRSTPMMQTDPAYPNLEGPGIGVQPFVGPGGVRVIAYHVDAPPNTYAMASRPLCFQWLHPSPSPYVTGGHPWPTANL